VASRPCLNAIPRNSAARFSIWWPPAERKVYCAVVLDTFSRRVVGWSIYSSQTAALVTNALAMAIANRDPQPGVIVHSDHGVQFTSWAFTDRVKRPGLVPSMG